MRNTRWTLIIYAALLVATLLWSRPIQAGGPDEGHFEAGKYVLSNVPAHTDLSGQAKNYYIDFEMRWYFLGDFISIMGGADAHTGTEHFQRVAGRAELALHVKQFKLFFWHRSDHNMDYEAKRPSWQTVPTANYINDNRVGIRYSWEKNK